MQEYDSFMAQAEVVFEEFTGAKKRPADDEEEKAKQLQRKNTATTIASPNQLNSAPAAPNGASQQKPLTSNMR